PTADRGDDLLDQRSDTRTRLRQLDVFRRLRRVGSVGRGDHPGRRIADAEQAALALGHDLVPDVRLVDAGRDALEVAQRLPLPLADGLPGRLHGDLVAHFPLR